VMLLGMPIQVAVLRLIFLRQDVRLTEIAVFALYIGAQWQLAQALLLGGIFELLLQNGSPIHVPRWVMDPVGPALVLGAIGAYVTTGVAEFFGTSLWRAVLAAVIAFFGSMFAILTLNQMFGLGARL